MWVSRKKYEKLKDDKLRYFELYIAIQKEFEELKRDYIQQLDINLHLTEEIKKRSN